MENFKHSHFTANLQTKTNHNIQMPRESVDVVGRWKVDSFTYQLVSGFTSLPIPASEEQIPNEWVWRVWKVWRGCRVHDSEGLIALGLQGAHVQAGGRQDPTLQSQHTSGEPCLPNPWPPLQPTLPAGAKWARWCDGFLMRLSRDRTNQANFLSWPKQS